MRDGRAYIKVRVRWQTEEERAKRRDCQEGDNAGCVREGAGKADSPGDSWEGQIHLHLKVKSFHMKLSFSFHRSFLSPPALSLDGHSVSNVTILPITWAQNLEPLLPPFSFFVPSFVESYRLFPQTLSPRLLFPFTFLDHQLIQTHHLQRSSCNVLPTRCLVTYLSVLSTTFCVTARQP